MSEEVLYAPPKIKTIEEQREHLENLVASHSAYIEKVLFNAGVEGQALNQIMFHYETAFKHGYRHGAEDYKNSIINYKFIDGGNV